MTWRRFLLISAALVLTGLATVRILHPALVPEVDPGKEMTGRTAFMLFRIFDGESNDKYFYVSHGPGEPEKDNYKSLRFFYGPLNRMEPVETNYTSPYRCQGWHIITKAGTLNTSAGQYQSSPRWDGSLAAELDTSEFEFREYERIVRLLPRGDIQQARILPVKTCKEG